MLYKEGHRDGPRRVLTKKQNIVRERGGAFRDGRFPNQASIEIRKREPLARRSMVEMILVGKPTDLDARYRDFAIYMTEYIEVRRSRYSTEKDEAIDCRMTTQSEQVQR